MQRVLGKKQRIANSDWIDAMKRIEDLVTKQELEDLEEQTIDSIRKFCKGKKAAFGWSGGKDSLAIRYVCEQAGIKENLLAISDLEYPAFKSWCEENKSDACEIVDTHQDLDWLKKHPDMLFPKGSKEAGTWFHIVQHRAQAKYYKEHELDVLLVGRRHADGNFCGRGHNFYTNGEGITRFSPLADWTHEAVLACIHYHKIPMPPIYGWKNGYLCGTHPWPARQWTGSVENGYKEVYDIDPSIVIEAAGKIDSANEFLKTIGKEVR